MTEHTGYGTPPDPLALARARYEANVQRTTDAALALAESFDKADGTSTPAVKYRLDEYRGARAARESHFAEVCRLVEERRSVDTGDTGDYQRVLTGVPVAAVEKPDSASHFYCPTAVKRFARLADGTTHHMKGGICTYCLSTDNEIRKAAGLG